jgi:alpha-D-ribose 1-methylphosphonate 5-phosphate C-P lyase
MTDISATGVFVCLAASTLFARVLPHGSLAQRMVPLMLIVPAVCFAFCSIEMPIPRVWNTAAMALALVTISVEGFLKLRDLDRVSERTNSNR